MMNHAEFLAKMLTDQAAHRTDPHAHHLYAVVSRRQDRSQRRQQRIAAAFRGLRTWSAEGAASSAPTAVKATS